MHQSDAILCGPNEHRASTCYYGEMAVVRVQRYGLRNPQIRGVPQMRPNQGPDGNTVCVPWPLEGESQTAAVLHLPVLSWMMV